MFFFQFLCNHVTRVRVPITICTDSTGVCLKKIERFSFGKRKIYCTTISLVKIKKYLLYIFYSAENSYFAFSMPNLAELQYSDTEIQIYKCNVSFPQGVNILGHGTSSIIEIEIDFRRANYQMGCLLVEAYRLVILFTCMCSKEGSDLE